MSTGLILLYNFIVGTVSLVYGVHLMSKGLEKANADVIKKVLERFTGKLMGAFAVGTVITALVQSSTAVTVLTVGLVNSGLMRLAQAVGIIYGANIGTTFTAQLMSFRITDFAVPLLCLGFVIRVVTKMFSKNNTFKNLSLAMMGIGFMFLGIAILNSGVPYIKESEFAYDIFKKYGQNPYVGLLAGMITTMLVHSSSATVGLTIVLFNANLIGLDAALGLTLGDNIGTCITAQVASIGTSVSARRTAWAHTLYNVIGVLGVFLILTPFAKLVGHITFILGQDQTRMVANAHTIFNVLSALVFLPITRYYVKFIEWLIPNKGDLH